MKSWMSGLRAAVVIVGLWIVGWGLGYGGIMEAFIDPDGKIGDIWPMMLGIPGLIGGLIFGAALLFTERGRAFDAVPFIRFVLWGVVTGIVLGLLTIPAKVGDVSPGAVGMIGIATALGTVAGLGTGLFFRLVTWWLTPSKLD